MIDLDRAIASAVKTGKVAFGAGSAVQNAQSGKAKLIVLASNCPRNMSESIEYYCRLSSVPLIVHKNTSLDLGKVCGKPFAISALSIREAGDSDILKLTETAEPEETAGGNE